MLAAERHRPYRVAAARCRALQGDHAGALTVCEQLLPVGLATDERSSPWYELACIHSLASAAAALDHQIPVDERDRLADSYAHQAVEFLQRAITQQNWDPEVLNDPDLEPLRDREDFQQLFQNDPQQEVRKSGKRAR